MPRIEKVPRRHGMPSVRFGKDSAFGGRLAADQAFAGRNFLIQRNRAAGRTRLLANPGLARRISAPIDVGTPVSTFTSFGFLGSAITDSPRSAIEPRSNHGYIAHTLVKYIIGAATGNPIVGMSSGGVEIENANEFARLKPVIRRLVDRVGRNKL